jgi:lipopolysaccharide/colanic/teichoic acid biosynthesis glycosyltransferase
LIPGDPQGTDSLECIRFIDKKEYTADVFSKYHLDTSLLEQMQLQDLVRKRRLYYYCKRVLDIFLSVLFLIPALPIMLIISVCIRLNSKGPVIFRQERSGLNEQLFEIYKFRTMYADTPKYALSPDDNVSDYRITRLGRILRCTGLDELPQLLNIIKGDMSLVGPRPEMPFLVEEHRSVMWFRSLVKPGLTGIWQLSPFRERQIYEHLEYDLYYLQSQSMLLDLKILMKTICHTFAVLTRKIIDRCRKAI